MKDFEKNWENILRSFDTSCSIIGAKKTNWKLLSKELSDLRKKFSTTKNGITGSELHKLKESWQSDRPFTDSEGNSFVLYINDQSVRSWGSSYYSDRKYKFHLCWCQTLETMTQKGRRARYKAKYDIENNLFNIHNGRSDKQEELEVCKHCLSEMDYKNYSSAPWSIKGNIYSEFIMLNFFNEYGKQNLKEPTHQHYPATYTEDWVQKSKESKEKSNFTCSECGKSKEINPNIVLQTHHKNGVKSDNSNSNLIVLCKDCHAKQPNHSHMKN